MHSDQEIIEGFRRGDGDIFRRYFYEYCQVAYYTFDRKYDLSKKQNLDFMSLAHQYALYLMEHDWKPLEDRSPNVSLRTWMVNGFRYIVLDALKWYKKEYGSLPYQEYLKSFDTSQNLRLNFNKAILELCDTMSMDRKSRAILIMLLVDGFKTKEVAAEMGITSAAVSQRYNALKETLVIPYFRENFDMDFDMEEVVDLGETACEMPMGAPSPMPKSYTTDAVDMDACILPDELGMERITYVEKKRSTPEYVTELAPGEIFVFGSNLRGLHGGGAAYVAYRRFGAVMGQGSGLQGRSYAIPTMQGGVETVKPYVDEFIDFAREHQELIFLVTRIGCGIAGFSDEEMSPLFKGAHKLTNIILPAEW